MQRDDDTNPVYQQDKVEALILDIVIERRRIGTDALVAEVVIDTGDEREMETARQAISGLREHGLLEPEQEDGTLEPTATAIKAAALKI